MIPKHIFQNGFFICFILIAILPGCGNPSKEDLFGIAPFLLFTTIAVAYTAERLKSRFITYLVSIVIGLFVFIANMFFQMTSNNRFFYFTIIIQTFIIYTAIVHILLSTIIKRSNKKMKSLILPSFSVLIILISFLLVVSLNANPSGEVGDLTVTIFGWPLRLFAYFSRLMNI